MNNRLIKLSVVIPAYNESQNLKSGVLNVVDDYLKKQKYQYEVLIVDDGSKDETINLVEKSIKNKTGFKLIKNPHGGKAITVMSGLMMAEGEVVIFTDMDQATPINQIEKFLPKFNEGYDIVIGSRTGRKGAPLIRQISAWGFSMLRNIILGLPFSDTQCGFKALNKKSINMVIPGLLKRWQQMKSTGAAVNAGFDVEMLFLAKKRNFKIAEVGVVWHYVGTERVQLIKDAVEATRDMLKIRFNELQGKYGQSEGDPA